MSDPELEPLPAAILALLEREPLAYPEDVAMKAAVLARVETAVILQGPGGGGDGPGGGAGGPEGGSAPNDPGPAAGAGGAAGAAFSAAHVLAAVALGSFLAGGAVSALVLGVAWSAPNPTPSSVASVVQTAPADPRPTASAETSSGLSVHDLPTAAQPISPTPSIAPSPSPSTTEATSDLAREQALLDVARAALARGNADGAIAALGRHAQRWPHGLLAEERDVVWIQALAGAGRRDEALERATRFRRDRPGSVFTSALDRALEHR
jgi:hypothetical protein